MSSGSEQRVECELADAVMLLRLNRPAKRNALDSQAWVELLAAMEEAHADPEVRAVVVTGNGENFCGGTDLSEMKAGGSAGSASAAAGPHPVYPLLDLLTQMHKPLIAAVDGAAVGFGLTFLFHCDFVYVTPGAKLRAPFVELGVAPEAGSSFLAPLLLGYRNAAELLLGAEFIDGARAVEIGLANACVSSDRLLPTALDRARSLANRPARALQASKRLLIESRRVLVQEAQQREGAAFAELLGSGRKKVR